MSNQNLPAKILLVDDDPSVAQALVEPLAKYNIRLEKACDLDTALYLFNQQRFDVALIELEFGPIPGVALVQKWRNHDVLEKRTTGMVVTAGNKREGVGMALIKELGELEVLPKPFTTVQLLPFLSRAMATRKRGLAFQEMKAKHLDYFARTGDFDKAAEQVQKNLKALGPQGLATLCDLYEKANRFDDALPILDKMLERDAENIGLLNSKGRMLMRLGKFNEAKPYLEKADRLAPKNIDRINELATMYLHLQQPDQSVAKFKELLDLNPENTELKFEMFSQLYEHGFDEHAVTLGKETTQPMEIVRHYNNKGVMMAKDGQAKEAIIEYQRALRFFPKFRENYRIYFNIALAYTAEKNRDAFVNAQANLKKCLELKPDFEKAQNTLETVRKALGHKQAS